MGNIQYSIYFLLALLLALSIHEYAHALAAVRAGDNTPKRAGRLTLNPMAHLDIMGALFLVFMAFAEFGVAWGKPVPVNPNNFRNPKRDEFIVSIAGIFFNLCLAAFSGFMIRYSSMPDSAVVFFQILIRVNVWLAIFNLIPIYPLDGSRILMLCLPYSKAMAYQNFMIRYNMMIFLGFILFLYSPFRVILTLPIEILTKLFGG